MVFNQRHYINWDITNKGKDGLNRRRMLRQLSTVGVGIAGVTTGKAERAELDSDGRL
jgi:hypothetical protein